MTKKSGDIDIDMFNRNDLLKYIKHIPASIISKDNIKKHNTGVYVKNVPIDPVTGLCSLSYKEAEQNGIVKLDFLNNSSYKDVDDEEHLNKLLADDINWDLLKNKDIVEKLPHIHNYYDLLQKIPVKSVEDMAMFIAVLRPGKKHLQNKSWSIVAESIWDKTSEGFIFKKSHSIAYALSIVVQLALYNKK